MHFQLEDCTAPFADRLRAKSDYSLAGVLTQAPACTSQIQRMLTTGFENGILVLSGCQAMQPCRIPNSLSTAPAQALAATSQSEQTAMVVRLLVDRRQTYLSLFGQLKVLIDLLPVHHIPPGRNVLHAPHCFSRESSIYPFRARKEASTKSRQKGFWHKALPQGACYGTYMSKQTSAGALVEQQESPAY